MMYLESIYFKAKEDLDDLEDDIKDEGAKWEQYDSHRMDDEVKFSPEDIIQGLKDRIRQIELVIDDHLVHLHGKENLERFSSLSYDIKLRYLLDKQECFDFNERVRMIDITQSYNIFDSTLFKEAKFIEELVEENKNYTLIDSTNSKVIEKANHAFD